MVINETKWQLIYKYLVENTDERVKDYPMMTNVAWVYLIIISYLLFIYWLGPEMMKNREAFKLKPHLITYNAILAVIYLFSGIFGTIHTYARSDWNFWCQPYMPIDKEAVDMDKLYGFMGYSYFLLKLADLFTVIFCVLRKKDNQVTFLHVFHHVCMFLVTYYFIKNLVLGHLALVCVVNCFELATWFIYNLLTVLKPQWNLSTCKKLLCQIQLFLFLFYAFYVGRPLVMQDCDYPNFILAMTFLVNFALLILLSIIYWKTYLQINPGRKNSPDMNAGAITCGVDDRVIFNNDSNGL